MIDTKKEQERGELHRAIWAIADELRGAVDGWDFKNYVLGTMFYRYISENLANYINSGEADAGLVYVTDAATTTDVERVDTPAADAVVNTYPLVALNGAANPEAASAFVAFVLSDRGQQVLSALGFGAP